MTALLYKPVNVEISAFTMGSNDSSAIILMFPLVGVSSFTVPLPVQRTVTIAAMLMQPIAITTDLKVLYFPDIFILPLNTGSKNPMQ